MTEDKRDESLGVEQLPQDELEASPGSEDQQAEQADNTDAPTGGVIAGSSEQVSVDQDPGNNNL